MKDEIKEILDELKETAQYDGYLYPNKIDKLSDYIINLQEENHKLKELCDKYEEEHSTTFEYWKNQLEANKHTTLLQGEDNE